MNGAQCESSTAFNHIRPGSCSLDDSSFKLSGTLEAFILVYLDENLHNRDLQLDTSENLKSIITCVQTFDDGIKCLSYMKCIKYEQIFLVVSGKLGKFVTQFLHTLPQLAWIYIFCLNILENEEWSKNYSKIRGVYADRSSLLTKLARDVEQGYINLPSTAIFSTPNSNIETSIENLNKCNGRFIFYQLLPEVMLRTRTRNVKDAKDDFVVLARFCYKDEKKQLDTIHEFEETYESAQAINWYTKNSFVYRIVNKAIRVANFNTLWKCRFFIADLHEQLQAIQFNEGRNELITVYRGQMISKDELNYINNHIGSYIMFKTFISTTASREVAERFAGNGEDRPLKESVLFEMKIDGKYTANPLSPVGTYTQFPDEEETLLSMGNAFRIESVQITGNCLWTIRLEIVSNVLNSPIVFLRKYMGEPTTLLQLKKFVLEPGFYFINDDSSKVEQLISTLDLRSFDKACFHVTIGHFQLNYEQKLLYYHKAINSLQQGHPLIPLMLNSIAAIYYRNSNYDVALTYYEMAYATNERSLLSSDKLIQMIGNLQKPPNEFLKFKNYELRSAALNHLSSGEEITISTTGHNDSCNQFCIPRCWKFHLGLQLEEQLIAYARITDSSSEKEKNRENVCKLFKQIADLYAQEENYTTAITTLQRLIHFMGPPTESPHPTTIQTTATIPPSTRIPIKDEKMLHASSNTIGSYVTMKDSNWSDPDEELQTPFQRACLLGRLKFVQRMLEAGVPANQYNQYFGCTSRNFSESSSARFRRS
ncbi:unnamed protein product [Rotaria sp. Silwood2]|nr:unnamed protein product [Rotaria sp. Silwood2]